MVHFDLYMDLIGCLLLVAATEAILELISVEHFACWCIRTAEVTAALSERHIFLDSKDNSLNVKSVLNGLFSTLIKHR